MMSGRALNRRNIHEKQAIACLRGRGDFELRHVADDRQAFARLSALARGRGLTIFPPGARFISDGEVALLADLAAAQRLAGRAYVGGDEQDRAALLQCAAILREAGICLPMAVLQSAAPGRARGKIQTAKDRPMTGMARNRALSLVRAREIASTHDFAEAGVSRQSVSRFCKDGLIQRVRHGWYRAAPLLPRNASAARLHG
ncbi:type IV toxin-antitoxin system AbiEi family antitoxin domain-containing protein [Sphingomonas bisphenolicum]|uniref:AbiEi antitoxin N-terminal domain-containing protein n=2 Tax=Sphingomonas TaxID=13687 RepID=A0ABM7G068_9SPHN|nr:hypothetical protein SBA_ch1_08140 [Sphingomonas bisphenolicum]